MVIINRLTGESKLERNMSHLVNVTTL